MKVQLTKLHEGCTSDVRPAIVEDMYDGKGGFYYNHNIEEINVENDPEHGMTIVPEPTETSVKMFKFDRLDMEAPKTANHILQELLDAKFPDNIESKLQNEYNSAKLGLYGGSASSADAKEKVASYKEFLEERIRIKAMVDADCLNLNIPQRHE